MPISAPVTISVVIPNRNHARYLRDSLAALVAQTRPFDEIVVVDDASTDDSVEVIESFARDCPALRLIRNEHRLAVAGAVRRGVRAASSRYIVMASADEMVDARFCEVLGEAVERFPEARLGVSKYSDWFADEDRVVTYGPESDLGMWYVAGDDLEFVDPERFHRLLASRFVWLSMNTAIMRRDSLEEVGVFDDALAWHSDWFAIYALAFRHGFVAVPQAVSRFRVDQGSYSGTGMRDRRAQERVMLAIQEKIAADGFRDVGVALDRSPAALSPLMRPMLMTMLRHPRFYPRSGRLLGWWLGQVLRMERPGALRSFKRRLFG